MNDQKVLKTFLKNVNAGGVSTFYVKSKEELQETVLELTQGVSRVYCPRITRSERTLIIPPDVCTLDYACTITAVEEAAGAIAETGSLVCTSAGARVLEGSLLPEHYVALVAAENIFPGLDELFVALRNDIPGNITLITGPSRTADIEKTLVTGVHGPKRLDVIVFEGIF